MSGKQEKNDLKEVFENQQNHKPFGAEVSDSREEYKAIEKGEIVERVEEKVKPAHPAGTAVFFLPSGKEVVIRKGKGVDARIAMANAGQETDKYMNCLMARMVTVDSNPLLPEDFDNMDMGDYMKIQTKFSELNFL